VLGKWELAQYPERPISRRFLGNRIDFIMVRNWRLESPRFAAPDPKSYALRDGTLCKVLPLANMRVFRDSGYFRLCHGSARWALSGHSVRTVVRWMYTS
jgi:hypothetical protein